jgi:phage/plasmid-like protein (TIGR03299 family)
MAHELTKNDGLALADTGAWHGMGTVVKGAMNPFAALKIAGLEWSVEESDSITGIFNPGEQDEYRVATDSAKVLVRSDDKSVLGVVGPDYTPFQNQQLAELAYALRSSADGNAEVETAGSIRGGRRVWMLLRGKSVEFGAAGDETVPYLFIANGHDGSLALKAIPTGIRVVCSNTFHMALGARRNAMSFRHTLNLNTRVEELARCIKNWENTIEKGAEVARKMAATPVTVAKVQSLWVDVIQRIEGAEIPANPKDGWEQRRKDRAVAGLAHAARVFDTEKRDYGTNLWVAANAITNWIQHARSEESVRTKDSAVRTYAAWDGTVADDVATALDAAAELVA